MTFVAKAGTNCESRSPKGRQPGDTGWRSGNGSRGRGLVTSVPGRFGQDTPGRHHDRSAGAISLGWDRKARVTPASDAWRPAVGFASCVAMRSVFRTIGAGAPNTSQEVAWLKLSGGVRSRPQVPWWNAERRACPLPTLPRKRGREREKGARRAREGAEVTQQRLSAFRFPFSCLARFLRHGRAWPGNPCGRAVSVCFDIDRGASIWTTGPSPAEGLWPAGGSSPVVTRFPRLIVTATGPTTGAV